MTVTLAPAPALLATEEIDLPGFIEVDGFGYACCTLCGTSIWDAPQWTEELADQAWGDHLADPETPRSCHRG